MKNIYTATLSNLSQSALARAKLNKSMTEPLKSSTSNFPKEKNMPHISAAIGANREIARELAIACIYQFADIRGPGNGVGNGSCCASVKLTAASIWGTPDYRFGQSQAHLLDADAVQAGGLFNPEHHAERQAHNAGIIAGGYHPYMFVELPPCPGVNGCAAWCLATIPGVIVWWLYPDTATMTAAHAGGTNAQFLALNTALP